MSNFRPQGMKPGYNPNPDWPKEVFRSGRRAYAHNDKELEELLRPINHPKAHAKMGGGWTLEFIPSPWPFLLYHPTQTPRAVGDPTLPNEANEAAKAEMLRQGWQVQPINFNTDPPQIDPKVKAVESDSRVTALEGQIQALQGMIQALISGQAQPKNLPPLPEAVERPYDPNWNPGNDSKTVEKAKRGRPRKETLETVGA